jgi:lipoprotein-releasing system permease protein
MLFGLVHVCVCVLLFLLFEILILKSDGDKYPNLRQYGRRYQISILNMKLQKLQLKIGQGLVIYFVQEDGSMPRARKFTISGIYSTGFSDLDALYGIIDIRHIQRLNKWDENQITGYEVKINKYDDLVLTASELLPLMPMHLQVKTIVDVYPQLFDWLGLLDLNVLVIIVLMVVVACINMSTALLILIVERSNMIGMLKAMGTNNKQVQSIFVVMAAKLIGKGLIIGNTLGLLICFTQYYIGWIKLDEEAYFLNQVPIFLNALDVVWINIGAFVLCLLIMLLPAQFVSKITPVKAIKFQ